jgi:hypothetical protein
MESETAPGAFERGSARRKVVNDTVAFGPVRIPEIVESLGYDQPREPGPAGADTAYGRSIEQIESVLSGPRIAHIPVSTFDILNLEEIAAFLFHRTAIFDPTAERLSPISSAKS